MQQEFLKEVVTRLETLQTPYAITGSIASNFWGIPRLTHDVDILIVLEKTHIPLLIAAFADPYYITETALRDALRCGTTFNIIDTTKSFKADFWVSSGDPFNQSLLQRRQRVELFPELMAYLASAEDVLLHKLVWNKITPSELADAAGIAAVQGGQLDLQYLRQWSAHQSTTEVLEEVLLGKYLKQT